MSLPPPVYVTSPVDEWWSCSLNSGFTDLELICAIEKLQLKIKRVMSNRTLLTEQKNSHRVLISP